jgi:hypothetical protein
MGHKVLQDHAYTFCQMFMGWRMFEDLGVLATLPDGKLTVDVLTGTCTHETVGPIDTYIAGEISAWFIHRLELHRIPVSDVLEAKLNVELKRIGCNSHSSTPHVCHIAQLVQLRFGN